MKAKQKVSGRSGKKASFGKLEKKGPEAGSLGTRENTTASRKKIEQNQCLWLVLTVRKSGGGKRTVGGGCSQGRVDLGGTIEPL